LGRQSPREGRSVKAALKALERFLCFVWESCRLRNVVCQVVARKSSSQTAEAECGRWKQAIYSRSIWTGQSLHGRAHNTTERLSEGPRRQTRSVEWLRVRNRSGRRSLVAYLLTIRVLMVLAAKQSDFVRPEDRENLCRGESGLARTKEPGVHRVKDKIFLVREGLHT